MNVAFHPDAEVEFNEAIEWYETREVGLGLDFQPRYMLQFNAQSPSPTPGK